MIAHKRSWRHHAAALAPLAAILLTFGTARVVAAQVVYEPFDYPAGTVMDGVAANGTNLTGTYTSPTISGFEPIAASPGLNYGSLIGAPSPAGNRLSQTTGTTAGTTIVSVDDDIATGGGTTTYFSALFTFSDQLSGNHLAHVSLVDAGSGDAVTFGEAGVGVRAIRVEANTDATGGSTVAAGADGAFTDGQTLLLIGRYVNDAAAGADTLHLLGYDTADAVPLPASFTVSDPNAQFSYALSPTTIDLSTISELHFVIRGTDNNFIDELRLGPTYAAVIPEPTAAAAVLVVAASAFGLRRPTRPRTALLARIALK